MNELESWEQKVLASPGAPERVDEIEQELRPKHQTQGLAVLGDPDWWYEYLSGAVAICFILGVASVLGGCIAWCVLAFYRNTSSRRTDVTTAPSRNQAAHTNGGPGLSG